MIPKNIYFYWGNEEMSFLRYMTFVSFRKYNPDWNIFLIKRRVPFVYSKMNWGESQDFMYKQVEDYTNKLEPLNISIQYIEDDYREIAELGTSDVHTSDLLSWYILANNGGIVSDTDIIYVKPFDYEKFQDVDFGICCFTKMPKANYMPVSFMIGQPNEIFEKIYRCAVNRLNISVYESAGTPAILESVGSFVDIKNKFPNLNVCRLPSKIVFPFSEDYHYSKTTSMMFDRNMQLGQGTIGIHWYAGGSQKYNRSIGGSNYMKIQCTISTAISKAIQ